MTDTHTTHPHPSTGITWSRRILVFLAAMFVLGAFMQFFLVGMSFFDDAGLWSDHAALGHILGFFPYVLWIPAVLGKAGTRIITACVALFILFMAQYAFIEVDNSVVNALHPLNGSIMLVLAFWITQRALGLLRQGGGDAQPQRAANLEGRSA